MVKSKRDPAIGKHWLAWYAFEGEEDLEFVREYVSHAREMLLALTAGLAEADRCGRLRDWQSAKVAQEDLSGLGLFLIGLEMAMAEGGNSKFKVEIKRRKSGKPINTNDRARRGHRAAGMVERLVQDGMKQEAAIATAKAETGLSRAEIFSWLKHRRIQPDERVGRMLDDFKRHQSSQSDE